MNITIIIGLLLLSGFLVPVWIVMQKQNKNKKKLEKLLSDIEVEKKIKITEHETWRDRVIGIDREHGIALFVLKNNEDYKVELVDLHNVSKCVAERSTISSGQGGSIQAVVAVRLRFVGRGKSQPDQIFTLFNEETDQTIGSEIMISEAWAERFNKLIRSMPKAA
jgi:hypothetical protein